LFIVNWDLEAFFHKGGVVHLLMRISQFTKTGFIENMALLDRVHMNWKVAMQMTKEVCQNSCECANTVLFTVRPNIYSESFVSSDWETMRVCEHKYL
jgi:hypothetical protein